MPPASVLEKATRVDGAAGVLDTRGMLCPYPFIRAKERLETLPPGSALQIITDSGPTAVSSIPILCEQNGYAYTVSKEGEDWRLFVTKP